MAESACAAAAPATFCNGTLAVPTLGFPKAPGWVEPELLLLLLDKLIVWPPEPPINEGAYTCSFVSPEPLLLALPLPGTTPFTLVPLFCPFPVALPLLPSPWPVPEPPF